MGFRDVSITWSRIGAWLVDVLVVSLIVSLIVGPTSFVPETVWRIAVLSSIAGAAYFFVFVSRFKTTIGLQLFKRRIESGTRSRLVGSALFGSMLLPGSIVIILLDAWLDLFGSLGVEVVS